jgi:hypothetical protein
MITFSDFSRGCAALSCGWNLKLSSYRFSFNSGFSFSFMY